jgi:hypothetical protein
MPQVSEDELSNAMDNFENFMYTNFDTQYILYSYNENLAGDFEIELPSEEDMLAMLDWDYEQVMEYLDDNYDIEALLYEDS